MYFLSYQWVNRRRIAKPVNRAYSRYSREAIALLGQIIHVARINGKLTVAELAERADFSRGLTQRIEHGDPG